MISVPILFPNIHNEFWHTYDLAYAYVQVCATVQVYNKVGKGYIVIINHYLGDNF